jgi:hypothetical protein
MGRGDGGDSEMPGGAREGLSSDYLHVEDGLEEGAVGEAGIEGGVGGEEVGEEVEEVMMEGNTPSSNRSAGWSLGTLITVAIVIFVLCVVAGIFLFVRNLRSATEDVTDPARYGAVLADLGYPIPNKLDIPRIDSFPAQIPSDATNVRFFYRPHFLQGGAILQLRLNEPAEKIEGVAESVQLRAKEVNSITRTSRPSIDNKILFRDEANQGFADLPAGFEVYVIDSKDTSVDTGYATAIGES